MRVAWFSAGVSSFIAAYIAKPDKVIYIDVKEQHPDSMRFVKDCERILGIEIEVIRDEKYGASVNTLLERMPFIYGAYGAPCTLHLKKRVRQKWEREHMIEPITYIWGYDVTEAKRAQRLKDSMIEFKHEFPLIDAQLTKAECHGICERLGVKRPIMYEMGYNNNNCVGCVKGGMGYWNKIRIDFPDVFEQRAKQERIIGHSCIKGVFLDELEPNRGRMTDEVMPECGFSCLAIDRDDLS